MNLGSPAGSRLLLPHNLELPFAWFTSCNRYSFSVNKVSNSTDLWETFSRAFGGNDLSGHLGEMKKVQCLRNFVIAKNCSDRL